MSGKCTAGVFLIAVLAFAAGAAFAVEDDLRRPLVLCSGAKSVAAPQGARLSPADVPAEFQPRDFPGILRDPSLSDEPDGLLWRHLRQRYPDVDPRELLLHPLAWPGRPGGAEMGAVDPLTFRILVLRVDFLEDSAGNASSTRDGRFDLRAADSARVPIDPPPHNRTYFDAHMQALDRYYRKQSGGSLQLEWKIYPAQEDSAYHLPDTADYGPWLMSSTNAEILALAEKLVRDSFAAADTSAEPPDFRAYDGFILFHAGCDLQGDINRDSPYDIPSFNISLADPVAVQDSTFLIDLIMVVPETTTQDGYLGALNGVVVHEFGHQLGFFDLYNVLTFFPSVGMFSLMDSGDQLFGTIWDPYREFETFVRGAIPGSVDPWHKLVIPFLRDGMQPIFVSADLDTALEAVQTSCELAVVPIGGQRVFDAAGTEYLEFSEYFILENRQYDLNGDRTVYLQADSTTGVILGPMNIPVEVTDSLGMAADELGAYEQDFLLPGEGILIWHVDNVAIDDGFGVCYGCVNVLPGRPGVDVEEADGIDDLGDIYSIEWTGGVYDYWFQGGFTNFGPDSRPGTNSSGGGVTGITIAVRDSAAVTMDVAITKGRTAAGWPIYVGNPAGAEFVTCADLDGDGTPEIVTGAGRDVLALEPDGSPFRYAGPGGLFAASDSLFLPGVAVRPDFVGLNDEERVLIAAASGSRVYAWSAEGEALLTYPPGSEVLPTLRFTTPPMLLDSVIVVGDSEGRLRGLQPGAAAEMLWRTSGPGFAVTAMGAGDLLGEGAVSLVWGNSVGEIFLAEGSQLDGYAVSSGWPQQLGAFASALDWLLLVAGSEGEAGTVIAVDEAGRVGLLSADGVLREGWPQELGCAPAGPPAVGDPDGDGCLEILATGTDGRIHIWNLHGQVELYWPRSVWHPDVTPIGELASGPVLADVTGDGRPEILQGSADGTLHLLTYEGEELAGWPAVVGFAVAGGPIVAPLESAEGRGHLSTGTLGIIAGDELGFVTLLETSFAGRVMLPGEMWRSEINADRTRFYAAELLPHPGGLSELIDAKSVRLTPNPVVGSQGWLRVRMGAAGTLRVRLLDTSGHQVWEEVFRPRVGAEGDLLPLDLAGLAPGLYVASITAEAGGRQERILRKLALVR